MSNKAVFYIVLAFILTSFFGALRDVAVEFIKASKEDANPSMMMNPMTMPFFFGSPRERQNQNGDAPANGRNIAEK
jgi:hypothetical protein